MEGKGFPLFRAHGSAGSQPNWVALPVEDRGVSPITGWTRAHWEAVVDGTLSAVRPFASPHHALINLPGPVSRSGRWSDGLEGYARTFLAAGFRLAHAAPEAAGGLADWYAEGLAAGTDPSSPERWPRLDEVGQARVEAASIVLALHESRNVLWDGLDDAVRQRVVEWLSGAVGAHYPASNWLWFQSIVQAFLREVGGPWSQKELDRNQELTESFYRGDGWYTDGLIDGRAANFDWYAGWAMHVYPLWFCRVSGSAVDPGMREQYGDRLRRYLEDVQHLFSPSGAPLYQGRSLTYRFATLAPVWAGAVFDVSPLPPGRTRRLASGVLRHFVEHGAWDGDGLQTLGWYGSFPPMCQSYSGSGSPYWSSKGLLGLVLPPEHEVWSAREERLVVEDADVQLSMAAPGWTVSATTSDGIVRLANHGSDHAGASPAVEDVAYSRIAYSTHAAPQMGPTNHRGRDSTVAIVDQFGEVSHRRPIHRIATDGRVGMSRSRAHWPEAGPTAASHGAGSSLPARSGPWITTASVLNGPFEVRVIRIDDVDATVTRDEQAASDDVVSASDLRGCSLFVSGYALASAAPATADRVERGIRIVRPDGLCSAAFSLRGLDVSEVARDQDANAMGPASAVPTLSTCEPLRLGRVYAALLVLSADPSVVRALSGPSTGPSAEIDTRPVGEHGGLMHVRVAWRDGTTDAFPFDAPV